VPLSIIMTFPMVGKLSQAESVVRTFSRPPPLAASHCLYPPVCLHRFSHKILLHLSRHSLLTLLTIHPMCPSTIPATFKLTFH
jgi:hypothetical protein